MSLHTFDLRYSTTNQYEPEVKGGHFVFTLLPCETFDQTMHNLRVRNSLDEEVSYLENAFGFTTILLTTHKSFSSLKLEMSCKVRKNEENPFEFTSPLRIDEEHDLLKSLDFRVQHNIFLKPSRLTAMDENDVTSFFPPFLPEQRVFDHLMEVTDALHSAVEFKAGVTGTDTTARQAWKDKEGVCQDFSHIFIGLARNKGIPARYVSGYLNQGAGFQGDSQMHAWVEAFVPGLGWKAFDPSNNLLANHNYIKVAHGVDYKDCSPIRGVMQASRTQDSSYTVQVNDQ